MPNTYQMKTVLSLFCFAVCYLVKRFIAPAPVLQYVVLQQSMQVSTAFIFHHSTLALRLCHLINIKAFSLIKNLTPALAFPHIVLCSDPKIHIVLCSDPKIVYNDHRESTNSTWNRRYPNWDTLSQKYKLQYMVVLSALTLSR